MSILSRMHKLVNALGGVGEATVGWVADIMTAPFVDDEVDGVAGTIFNAVAKSGTQLASSTIGPEGIGGTIFGAAPEAVRHPVRTVTGPIFTGLETAYREGIAEPISTLATVGSIGAATDNQLAFTSPGAWRKAYRIAQHRSPGQALALGVGRVNILDEAELSSYIGSDAYRNMSGTADFLLRVFADPTVIGGKAVAATRAKYITKPLHTPEQLLAALDSPQLGQWVTDIAEISSKNPDRGAAIIRDRYFPDHANGAEVATILHEAKTPQERFWSVRALMGDMEALEKLSHVRSRLHGPIASLNKRVEELAPIRAAEPYRYNGTIVPPETPSLLPLTELVPGAGYDDVIKGQLLNEIERYRAVDDRLARTENAFASLTQVPRSRAFSRVPAIGEIRTSITRSDFYQDSPLARPLHRIFDMAPQSMILASGKNGDVQINRLMNVAGMPIDRREVLRSQFMAAQDKGTRAKLAYQIENEAIAYVAKQAGMSIDEIDEIVVKISNSRERAIHELTKRTPDPNGHSSIMFEGEDGAAVSRHFPSWITQEEILIPLVDINKVKHATTQIGKFRAAHPTTKIPGELLESFYRLWKPAVLLRPAWTIRVVGDEQGRILAKVGALVHLDNLRKGMRNYTTDYIASVKDRGFLATRGKANRELREEFGVRGFSYRGYDGEGAFGTPTDINRHQKELVSSAQQHANITGNRESAILRDWRASASLGKSLLPTDEGYAAAYDYAVKKLHSNPIVKKLFEAEKNRNFMIAGGELPENLPSAIDNVVDWLHSTPEGSDILRSNSVKGHNARNWVEVVADNLSHYSDGSDELLELIRAGKATHADLARLIPDPSAQPITHGELLHQDLGEGYTSQLIARFTERAFESLGKVPTDTMSRNRFFDEMFQAEVKRRVDLIDGDYITPAMQARIRDGARDYALTEVRTLLYDLAESSQLGRMLKFLSPFYNAWQEVGTRWAGLAIENPAFIARARMAWRAPDKAGLVTDEDGKPVLWGQTYSDDPLSDNYRGKERFLTLPIPDWVDDLPFMGGVKTKGSIGFNKKSFSMLMALPGFGPPVQLAVNEMIKDRPDLASSFKFILPFGPTQDEKSLLLPAAAKRLVSMSSEDEQFLSIKTRIYMDQMTDFMLGKRDDKPTYESASQEAVAFFGLRTVAALGLPASPTFRSPYQLQINALNLARARYSADEMALADEEGNARTPDEWFLDVHGKEYFYLTQAVTRSMDGIPPTLEAWEERKKYEGLIEKYPELGGLIIGKDGAGEFNSAVYNLQKDSQLRPGSDKNQREPISFEEAAIDPERRLGWIEYRRAMDMLEATRIQRGLPNLQVAAAQDLAAAKAAVTQYLSDRYPAWKEDFNQTDKGKWENKIKALREIAFQPEMSGRADMKGIRDYLYARDEFNKVLAARSKAGGAKTLSASTNRDLAEAWNAVTGHLIESNLPFSAVFYRHLENDPLGL